MVDGFRQHVVGVVVVVVAVDKHKKKHKNTRTTIIVFKRSVGYHQAAPVYLILSLTFVHKYI